MRRPRFVLGAMAVAIAATALGCGVPGSGSASPSPDPSGGSSLISPELAGSWTVTITPDDLAAAGLSDGGLVGENTGTFTMMLNTDGTWSTTQATDVPVRWPVFRGTLSTTGPDSFRQTTTFPADYAGDVVDFTWVLEDGALALKVTNPPDEILPILIETHRWQRAD